MLLSPHAAGPYFLCLLASITGKSVAPNVFEVAGELFPEGAPANHPGLLSAVGNIAKTIGPADARVNTIGAGTLDEAVAKYMESESEGTPFCRPVREALAKIL